MMNTSANATIADVTSVVTKGTTPTTLGRHFTSQGVGFIKAECISSDGALIEEKRVYIDAETDQLLRRSRLQKDDVLFSIAGVIGRAALVPQSALPANTNQALAILRPDPQRIIPSFLYYTVRSKAFQDHSLGHVVQTAQANVSLGVLNAAPIWVPPFHVQQRISSILSAYDELIENSQRRIKILESMARALYREWFVHFRFPGHESVPRVASALGEIPQGWGVKALADVCSRITDGSHFSPASVETGYPMASVKDMHDWGIKVDGCRRITSDDYQNLVRNDCKPRKGDVLIAKDGSYLKHTFVVGEEQDLVVLSSIAMLRPNDAIRPNYLCLALRDPMTKARMKGIVSGVAIPRIVLKDFRKFQILVPPEGVQSAWARIADPMLEVCRMLIAQTENLRRTRDLLLPRLLSGQIDVESIA